MHDVTPGFAVIYRWRLVPGMEDVFREGWERVTVGLKRNRGALGSRLHRADDGTWVAYAQWPDRESRAASSALPSIDPEASAMMAEATAEFLGETPLIPVRDHLG